MLMHTARQSEGQAQKLQSFKILAIKIKKYFSLNAINKY